MKTKIVTLEGVDLIAPADWVPAWHKLDLFKSCCGAGEGLGEKLIPDKLLGLRISAACAIHDYEFEHGEATWHVFHAINFRFFRNIHAIIRARSKWGMGLIRVVMASIYFYSVDTKGAAIYKRLKEFQGLEMEA